MHNETSVLYCFHLYASIWPDLLKRFFPSNTDEVKPLLFPKWQSLDASKLKSLQTTILDLMEVVESSPND